MNESKYEPHFDASLQGVVIGEGNTVNIFPNDNQQRHSENTLPPSIWTVPYPSNPFFTGREHYLDQLRNNLLAQKAAALTQPQAINGLGGIGKTQIAVEYAHRHRENYPYVFWVNAATLETLYINFMTLAKLLRLPISNETHQEIIIIFVRNWLDTHERWLLIMDNADNLELAHSFLPTRNTGHIILTTRGQVVSSFANIELQKMDIVESTLMLLRRANRLYTATDEEKKKAEIIAKEMDGLPLALDQAGAYIEETGCTLTTYVNAYHHRQKDLLNHRGNHSIYHSEPVATTWSLSFEQVEKRNPLAAELLRCCAFLAPDNIPEEFFIEEASELSPQLQPIKNDSSLLDEAVGELRRFSFIRRNREEQHFSLHRLVQEVLRMEMDEPMRKTWMERTVCAMNEAFPEIDFVPWSQCERYLPHALHCAKLIDEYALDFSEAAELLFQTANYLYARAQYLEAEPLYQQALSICEKVLGPEDSETATVLHDLAHLYEKQNKYKQAENYYKRELSIREEVLGSEHPDTAKSLECMGVLYSKWGKYEQAESYYQRASAIREKT